ncbi:hypothetical protein PIIN_11530 [Serendipita indica DSM 11827]|uniref:Uncharacterized protein n=1 Tax=Serendipita indica (strain DSM 11827) TaxID=1109443 RepID=G4U1W0_SERID|nr:hypothetical protein PIIN_11530 [Serendipita indica DSM 11827]
MDPPLNPPLRIDVQSVEPASSRSVERTVDAFLSEYRARDGDAAVTAQMEKFIKALAEENRARKKTTNLIKKSAFESTTIVLTDQNIYIRYTASTI